MHSLPHIPGTNLKIYLDTFVLHILFSMLDTEESVLENHIGDCDTGKLGHFLLPI